MAAGDATRFADRRAAVPQNARMRILPVDRKRFVHLHVLAGFDAAAAENALVGIVAIERIGVVDLVRLGLEGDFLVLDREHLGRVVDRAVAVVVVADRAVEQVILEDAIERLALRGRRRGGLRRDLHRRRKPRSRRPARACRPPRPCRCRRSGSGRAAGGSRPAALGCPRD